MFYFTHNYSLTLIQALHIVLQNAPFCIAKLPLLECKTATFGTQNCHFWNAKRTVLERKTGSFGNHPNLLWILMCP